jgi:hypothetical protein
MSGSESESEESLVQTSGEGRNVVVLRPEHEVTLPLKPNTTGFFLFTVFQFFDKPSRKEVGHCRALSQLLGSTLLHITNLIVQFVLMFALLFFCVEREEDKFEQPGLLAKAPELNAAAASGVALNVEGTANAINQKVLDLCHSEHHVPYTQSVIICLWAVKLLPAVIQSFRFTYIAAKMPNKIAGMKSMMKKDGAKLFVVSMPLWLKVFVFLFANLPRVLLQIWLFYMGGEYLMYATSLNVLVTKAVGLAFIETMSDLLFQGLSSDDVDHMKNVFLSGHERPSPEWWDDWGALLTKFSFCVGISVLLCRVYHGDVQQFRDACFRYHYAFDVPNYTYQGMSFLGHTLSN